jgi:hypothetical protein
MSKTLLPADTFLSDREFIKSLFRDYFVQFGDEVTNSISEELAQVNDEHRAEIERQLLKFSEDVEAQIKRVEKRIVGWWSFIAGLLITFIISTLFSIWVIYELHEKGKLTKLQSTKQQIERIMNKEAVIPKSAKRNYVAYPDQNAMQ